MTPRIYDQHSAAFANVEAHVVLHNGEPVARIAFKFPRDGAGRLYAYVHWLGLEMVRGYAGGYGYDKRTAACASAVRKMVDPKTAALGKRPSVERLDAFLSALERDSGQHWDGALRDAGFETLQAV